MNDLSKLRPLALFLGLTALGAACQIATPGAVRGPLEAPPLQRHAAPTSEFDVDHYSIDLRLYPELRSVKGTCTVRLYPRTESIGAVTLDLAGLEVTAVEDGQGRSLLWRHQDDKLTIELDEYVSAGQATEVAITYAGQPAKGLWFTGDGEGEPTQVFTQGEAEDSHWWFPCQDFPADRASSELRVTMPQDWRSVAAGELVERTVLGDVATEHWRMDFPHPTYLVTLVAGRFHVLEEDWNGIPLLTFVDPTFASLAPKVFESTPDILDFLNDLTGIDYPYPKYSQACVDNFPFGGMENISATTLTDTILIGERGLRDGDAKGLIAHEAAHQWFGDLLTCRDWSHIWLNESFATYAELLYVEHSEGVDAFRAEVRDTQEKYLEGDIGDKRRPIVWNAYRDPIDLFFGGQVYPGGASRLHLLRHVMGDASFFEGLQSYVKENVGRGVVTADFQAAMEAASGEDLGTFFDQWFHHAGFPEFQVAWSYDDVRGTVRVNVSQIQRSGNGTPAVFQTPVDIEIKTRAGSVVKRVHIDERSERFEIASADAPIWVRFDKHGWIPKRLSTKKEPKEWLLISAQDDDVNGRRDALNALGALARDARSEESKRLYSAQIANRLRQDPVESVRLAAATALATAKGAEARANLEVAARTDASAAVRTAALKGLAGWGPDPDLYTLGTEAYADGYSWKTMAAAAKLIVSARPEGAYEWMSRQLFTPSPHDALQGHLLEVFADLDHRGVREQLLRWARDETLSDGARSVAVREVARISPGASGVSDELLRLLDSPRYRVRRAALEALADYGNDTGSVRALEAYYPTSVFPREKRLIEGVLGL